MSLIDKELRAVWDALRGSRPHRENFLEEINVRKMRGIKDLRVPFDYPVTVLAGENACGKSTVLFGCAAAYKSPSSTIRANVPSTLFPNFSHNGTDNMEGIELEYAYIDKGQRMNMKWRRGKAWNRSYLGRKGATQPERNVYLRTLANLTNPSEVRNMLQIKRRRPKIAQVPPELLLLARRVLTFSYQEVRKVEKSKGIGNLLVANLAEGMGAYSEFHMASGERSILRLSMEISQLEDALVLIDEVETGLHPYIQRLLMLNLQQMSLRQNLQVIVTTHSPVVLDCVPLEGRIFLSRNKQNHDVRVEPPMRDVLQRALYGQSTDKLSIICEDVVSKSIILGTVDALSIKMNFSSEQVSVGRNTGQDEFPNHVRTLAKIGLLQDFIFVMDGDARGAKHKVQSAVAGDPVRVLLLPGKSCPEEWVWNELKHRHQEYRNLLAFPELQETMRDIEQEMSGTLDTRTSPFKAYMQGLCDQMQQHLPDIVRKISRKCAEDGIGEIVDFTTELQDQIEKWRTSQS